MSRKVTYKKQQHGAFQLLTSSPSQSPEFHKVQKTRETP